ncbi:MAG: type ISP restriction/modification enzyme, partial [Mammaliicoccus vitulinus]
QSGLIKKEDLLRKFTKEIYANEIVLLSYYIAAINIEETFKEINEIVNEDDTYYPFEGIVLTDTFETTEQEATLDEDLFGDNNERLNRQKESPITVIMGNPPYSIGQGSVNDNNQKTVYEKLDRSIEQTYAKHSTASLKKSLYDNYIRAFKWASDRLEDKGIIGFVTNASFIDSQSTDGLRKCWHEDFNHIYIFNLRGNQRTVGEKSRQEGGKIFGSGSRAPIAITILIKDGSDDHEIHYYDLGDYLSRDDKLNIISEYKSIKNIEWKTIKPDDNNDWINQRDESYDDFIPFISDAHESVFNEQYTGVYTSRDPWVTGFSRKAVNLQTNSFVDFYNNEVNRLQGRPEEEKLEKVDRDESKIKWSAGLLKDFENEKKIKVFNENIVTYMHRPFTKKWIYFEPDILERPSRYRNLVNTLENTIYIQGKGMSKDFSVIITNLIPSLQ